MSPLWPRQDKQCVILSPGTTPCVSETLVRIQVLELPDEVPIQNVPHRHRRINPWPVMLPVHSKIDRVTHMMRVRYRKQCEF